MFKNESPNVDLKDDSYEKTGSFIRNQKDALIYEFINKLNIVSYKIEYSHAPSLHFLL